MVKAWKQRLKDEFSRGALSSFLSENSSGKKIGVYVEASFVDVS
jgi:hypothetical protein